MQPAVPSAQRMRAGVDWRLESWKRRRSGSRISPAPQASTLHAWLGPAIGPAAFEVGEDVLDAFVAAADPAFRDATVAAFARREEKHKYLADLYALARLRLNRAGVPAGNVHGGTFCTMTDAERFYSYRRDRTTGRMAAMIWLAD